MYQPRAEAVIAFIKLGRLKFLGGGVLMYGLGVAIALTQGVLIQPQLALWGLLLILCTQLMTHYCNDYYDYEADCANATPTSWSGGSRVLPDGDVKPGVALSAALILAAAAVMLAAWLFWNFNLPVQFLWLVLAILFFSWFYSAPPLRLHSTGTGEVAAAAVVGVMWPAAGYLLQVQHISSTVLLASVPVFLLQFLMLITIQFPDEAGDAITGKKTLLVRLSSKQTAKLCLLLLLFTYLSLPLLVWLGLPVIVAIAVLALSPVSIWHGITVYRQDWRHPKHWGNMAFRSVFLFAATGFAELVAFLYMSWKGF